jgi:hypothetical protein
MSIDARLDGKYKRLVWLIQEELQVELSPKLKWDILCTITDVANYWKADSDDLRNGNYQKKWNEFCLYVRHHKPEGWQEILDVIQILNNDESIRWERVTCN